MRRIGLISDTHGLLRPEALAFLAGSDRIVHAGDIGGEGVLAALARIAPLTVVRGNNDVDAWTAAIPEIARIDVDGVGIVVIHDFADYPMQAADPAPQVVVCGHSHRPRVAERDGLIIVNPGSAGPRRFRLPVCVGELIVDGGRVEARLVHLDTAQAATAAPRRRP